MASMYDALADYLRQQLSSTHTMSFNQIEDVIGEALPRSARERQEWWGNERSRNSRHSQAKDGWLTAGWEVDRGGVDLARGTVTFRRVS